MIYTKEVENMCPVAKGAKHEPAPIPEEGKWVHSKKIEDISDFFHQFEFYIPIDYEDFANYIIKRKEGVKNKNETGK